MIEFKLNWGTKNLQKEDLKKDNKKSANNYISEQQNFRQFEDLKEWEDAVEVAQNLTNPDRTELNRIFDRIEQDPHFSAQWETRKMKTIEREFAIYDKGAEEPNEQLTEMFQAAWFHEFMHLALDSMKRGFVLINFGTWKENKFTYHRDKNNKLHKPIEHIPFNHVKPEFGYLLKHQHDQEGLDIFKAPISDSTLFIGQPKSFGLLFKCAEGILIKQNCLLNWSEFAEVFGHDLRIGKTDSTGNDRIAFRDMLKKMGAGGFGIMSPDDEVTFAGTSRTDAYKVYNELMNKIDSYISKVIFGQDVVMDHTGRVKGTAAESITDLYGNHDAKFLEGIINDELLPKMAKMGIPVEGKVFKWDNSESLTLQERVEIDLKISQMGKNVDEEYLTETYGVTLGENQQFPPVANPEEVAKEIKNLYGSTK